MGLDEGEATRVRTRDGRATTPAVRRAHPDHEAFPSHRARGCPQPLRNHKTGKNARRGDLSNKSPPPRGAVARRPPYPAEWVPGTKAGYHPTSGWKILGAVVEAVDGRPVDRYVADEVLGPAGMKESRLGIPPDEQAALGPRLVPVAWKGHAIAFQDDSGLQMIPYHIERIHNEVWHVAKVEPGGGMAGPARGLCRLYTGVRGVRGALTEPRN